MDDIWWKTTFGGRRPLIEECLWYKMTFDERQLWRKKTFDGRQGNLRWKATFEGKRPFKEDFLGFHFLVCFVGELCVHVNYMRGGGPLKFDLGGSCLWSAKFLSLLTCPFWLFTLDTILLTCHSWPALLAFYTWHITLDLSLLTCPCWLFTLDTFLLTFHFLPVTLELLQSTRLSLLIHPSLYL